MKIWVEEKAQNTVTGNVLWAKMSFMQKELQMSRRKEAKYPVFFQTFSMLFFYMLLFYISFLSSFMHFRCTPLSFLHAFSLHSPHSFSSSSMLSLSTRILLFPLPPCLLSPCVSVHAPLSWCRLFVALSLFFAYSLPLLTDMLRFFHQSWLYMCHWCS